MNNGYMVYLLRILAAQGALASVYTDPGDPEGFAAGFIEGIDAQHLLMCDLTPWGQIDGWRVRRNADVIEVLYGEEYEQRLGMLLAHQHERHRPFFSEPPAEETDLLLAVLLACQARGEIVSAVGAVDVYNGRVLEANGLRVKIQTLDFFGRPGEERLIPLREIEILEIGTPEQRMYLALEAMERERLTLMPSEETP